MTAAEHARDQVLDAVGAAHPGALDRALDVITAWADRGTPFSSNSCRGDMHAAGVPPPVIGRAFADAARRGLIRHTGYVRSTDVRTRAHPVSVWCAPGQPQLDQPRDDRGRFDAPIPPGQMTFEEAV